ncbi:hypothetical protein OG21DRAFT_423720 [Imleria badia]|nr:hypothetical protein OG21DRAFT_423720 [Imleria badia]
MTRKYYPHSVTFGSSWCLSQLGILVLRVVLEVECSCNHWQNGERHDHSDVSPACSQYHGYT